MAQYFFSDRVWFTDGYLYCDIASSLWADMSGKHGKVKKCSGKNMHPGKLLWIDKLLVCSSNSSFRISKFLKSGTPLDPSTHLKKNVGNIMTCLPKSEWIWQQQNCHFLKKKVPKTPLFHEILKNSPISRNFSHCESGTSLAVIYVLAN